MNLLCPNCQKMLTVPEEFAGQLMKCPMCAGTFTVPGLPGAAPPPGAAEPDVFSLRHDAPPVLPPPPPILNREPPPPSTAPPLSTPSLSSLPTEGYQHGAAVWFSPRVLAWIAPACLLLVFVLLFFNWVGIYPGGEPAVTQNAWQAAFGLVTVDGDLKSLVPFLDDDKYKPGVSVLALFYLLLLFPVLAATIVSAVLPMIPVKLPPAVEKILPWRWGIVAALNLILFLFLGLQVLLGFSLESNYSDWVNKQKSDIKDPGTKERKMDAVHRGSALAMLEHTFALRVAVFLHLVAIACAALMFWIAQRGPHRPMPKLELVW